MEKSLKRYVIWTYVVFYCAIPIIGLAFALTKSQVLFRSLQTLAAWVPTIVLMVMFHKIYPGGKRKDYVKSQFNEKLKTSVVITVILLYLGIFICSLLFTGVITHQPLNTLYNSSWLALLGVFGINILSGTTGEEIGWRSFLLTELQKRHSSLKAAVIVGVVWSFWHTLLWLVSGLSGLQLVWYIICFLITGVASSIITAAFYNLNRNLLVPMLTHQLLNFFLGAQKGDILQILTATAVMYTVAAAVIILVNYKKCLYGKALPGSTAGKSISEKGLQAQS